MAALGLARAEAGDPGPQPKAVGMDIGGLARKARRDGQAQAAWMSAQYRAWRAAPARLN